MPPLQFGHGCGLAPLWLRLPFLNPLHSAGPCIAITAIAVDMHGPGGPGKGRPGGITVTAITVWLQVVAAITAHYTFETVMGF